jgi:DNA-binding PadR family transcriptional regulator
MHVKRRLTRERALSPIAIQILVTLVDTARHGYAIKQEVERAAGGAVRLGPATLYESLQRLEATGLIEESARRPDPASDKAQRRYYALTPEGARTLESEVLRLGQMVDHARSKLGIKRPEWI